MGSSRVEEEQQLVEQGSRIGKRQRTRSSKTCHRCLVYKGVSMILLLSILIVLAGRELGLIEWSRHWPFLLWITSEKRKIHEHRTITWPHWGSKNNSNISPTVTTNTTKPSDIPIEPTNTSLRIVALEAALANVTQQLHLQSEALAVTQATVSEEEIKINKLQNEAPSSSQDLEFKDEIESKLSALDAKLAALKSEATMLYTNLDNRINTTDIRERQDAVRMSRDMETNAAAQRNYVDAKLSNAQAATDAKLNEIYQTLGDYKATTQIRFDTERDLIYDWIAGTFALLGFLVTLASVYGHTRKKHQPDIQRKILTLLWMPPIYSACSWLSLLYPAAAPGLNMVRDGYEAYTIWAFGSFLLSTVGDDSHRPHVVGILRRLSLSPTRNSNFQMFNSKQQNHESRPPHMEKQGESNQIKSYTTPTTQNLPLMYAPAPRTQAETEYNALFERVVAKLKDDGDALPRAFWPPCGRKAEARSFVRQCTFATMQFVLIKPTIAVASYVLTAAQNDSNSDRSLSSKRDWIDQTRMALFIIDNISVTIAFTGLLKVYHAVAHHLADRNPWPKFCSVKGIVFITFWQGVIIWIMTRTERLNSDVDIADTVQNFLICVEMFIASVVHIHTFSPDEWDPNYDPATFGVSDSFALNDFFTELGSLFGGRGTTSAETNADKRASVVDNDYTLRQEFKEDHLCKEKHLDLESPDTTDALDDNSISEHKNIVQIGHTTTDIDTIDAVDTALVETPTEFLPVSDLPRVLDLSNEDNVQEEDTSRPFIGDHLEEVNSERDSEYQMNIVETPATRESSIVVEFDEADDEEKGDCLPDPVQHKEESDDSL